MKGENGGEAVEQIVSNVEISAEHYGAGCQCDVLPVKSFLFWHRGYRWLILKEVAVAFSASSGTSRLTGFAAFAAFVTSSRFSEVLNRGFALSS